MHTTFIILNNELVLLLSWLCFFVLMSIRLQTNTEFTFNATADMRVRMDVVYWADGEL